MQSLDAGEHGATARIARKIHDGAIIMLHDASERGTFVPAAVRAIDAILEIVEHRGFSSVTLSELLVDSMIPSPEIISPPNSGLP